MCDRECEYDQRYCMEEKSEEDGENFTIKKKEKDGPPYPLH